MTAQKILITGGGGYIGGTIISELLSPKTVTAVEPGNIIAIIRKPEVAAKLQKKGIQVSDFSLTDEAAVESLVLDNEVNLVVHTASALDASLALPLIKALAAQKEKTGKQVYFIHTSGTSCVAEATGWKHGLVRDTDNVYELEKTTEQPYFVRATNTAVHDLASELGVILSTVTPPMVYGEGSGEGGRQTQFVPLYLQSAISKKALHKHKTRDSWPVVHVNDLAEFYTLLVHKILSGSASTAEIEGYFFPIAHEVDMWDTADAFAKALHAKGLVNEPKAVEWPSDEVAAKDLGMPAEFIPLLLHPHQQIEPIRAFQLGWKPKWDNDKYLASRADDVETYLKNADSFSAASFQALVEDAKKAQEKSG